MFKGCKLLCKRRNYLCHMSILSRLASGLGEFCVLVTLQEHNMSEYMKQLDDGRTGNQFLSSNSTSG